MKKDKERNDENFQGLWALDKFETFDAVSEKWTTDSGYENMEGYILYDGQGHMGVHLVPGDYKGFDTDKKLDKLNTEELKDLVKFYKSNFVYFAFYKINGSTISHKRISATEPNAWGTILIRDFVFNRNKLILTARELVDNKKIRLTWRKM